MTCQIYSIIKLV